MLNPSDSIVDWVLKTVPTMGAGWCPPGMLGIGIGGTAEKAMLLAKESLMEPIDIVDLKSRGPSNRLEEMRLELFDKVNALGIGAQGLGGLTTVLDIKIKDYPTHAANLPVAMIPNCAATRQLRCLRGKRNLRPLTNNENTTATSVRCSIQAEESAMSSLNSSRPAGPMATPKPRHIAEVVTGIQCRSEEHTSDLQSLMRPSYAVFCLQIKRNVTKDMVSHTHIVHTYKIPTLH